MPQRIAKILMVGDIDQPTYDAILGTLRQLESEAIRWQIITRPRYSSDIPILDPELEVVLLSTSDQSFEQIIPYYRAMAEALYEPPKKPLIVLRWVTLGPFRTLFEHYGATVEIGPVVQALRDRWDLITDESGLMHRDDAA